MWWQAILVTLAGLGFPTLALLFFIGGPTFRDRPTRPTRGN
ncbi:hypothetical protein [Kitasatospora viridis]|uniref:Uncharacterized protein n=1 Tax=Kitasatospora viridis TaxID=281105 RepID=A0A561UGW7_9ACTN|nr:hypothetical protein [Kitasatospora viridis]TWF98619.1 hypothetical protein FHX73_112440 [Kitasatospora viridis]